MDYSKSRSNISSCDHELAGWISAFTWSFILMFLLSSVAQARTTSDDGTYTNTVSIGTTSLANSKAVLDVVSTSKGILAPRMTTTQQNAIASPPEGLLLYDKTLHQPAWYNGTSWQDILSSITWALIPQIDATNGAASTPALTFSGTPYTAGNTTSNKPLVMLETSGATSTNWASAGTMFGVNAATGFGGRLYDGQVNGVEEFSVSAAGYGFLNDLQLGVAGHTGTLILQGTTSGAITVQPQSIAGTYNFNMPTSAGSIGQFLISGGGGSTADSWTSDGNTLTNLNASQVLTGTLSPSRGGTGQSSISAAFTSFFESCATGVGDVCYGGTSGAPTRLAGSISATKKFFAETGDGVNPAAPGWSILIAGDIPSLDASKITSGIFGVANGGTGQSSLQGHAVLLGEVTAGVGTTSGAAGQILQGAANADPTFTATPTLGVDGSTNGTISLAGATAGHVTIGTNSSTTSYTVKFPNAQGAANTFPKNDGSGNLTWSTIAGATYAPPKITVLTSTGSQIGWLFTISTSSTLAAGDTYTNNGNTYTVVTGGGLSAATGPALWMTGTGATSGSTLTRSAGAGTASITFTSKVATAAITVQAGDLWIRIHGVGGGGGGSSIHTATTAGGGCGGGGGGGSYFRKDLLSSLAATYYYAVGAAGAGATAGANDGGTGGTTYFGPIPSAITVFAPGGGGGVHGSATTGATTLGTGGAGSGSTNGDLAIDGGGGGMCIYLSSAQCVAGYGGASGIGGPTNYAQNTSTQAGVAGSRYGTGGGGSVQCTTNAADQLGGAGGSGLLVVEEYTQ